MVRIKDMTGETIGYLTITARAPNDKHGRAYWKCKCKCGKDVIVFGHDLRTGHTKSCGCLKDEYAADLTSQIFNQLTAIRRVENDKARNARWLCKCECGNETIVSAYRLQGNKIKSCGCLQKKVVSEMNKKATGDASFNRICNVYRHNAKQDEREYLLTSEDVKELISKNCHYCNKPPSQVMKNRYSNGDTTYTGIDRIDSTKDYSLDNVTPCCSTCNYTKHTLSEEVFLSRIKMIYENLHLEKENE